MQRTGRTALVLSGSIGRGHDSVAQACRVALERDGWSVRILDCMALLGSAGARIGEAGFRRVLSVPTVYDGFHFSHLRTGGRLPRAMARASTRRLLPPLRRELASAGPRPLVVPVFATGVSAAAALRAERPDCTAVAVCTDACAHRMWVADGIDAYVVCSPLAATTVRRYDPAARVATVPPPVRPAFFEAPTRAAAREGLGIPAGARCALLMAGGWGLGPLAGAASALADTGCHVLAVAGANERLHRRLVALARERPEVTALGLTDRVPELMAAADVVVTSAGQTCHEARVVGRPLVVLDVVPGHGRENALHELETGGALSCSADPASVAGVVGAVLSERPELPPWPVRDAAEWDRLFLDAVGAGRAVSQGVA